MAGFDQLHYDKTAPPDYQSYEDWNAMVAEFKPDNMLPPLPQAPCVLVVRGPGRGQIHRWSKVFAKRSDMCVPCDENGNTDPAAWQTHELPPPLSPTEVFKRQFAHQYSGPAPGATPQTHMAAQVLGASSPPVPDYTAPGETGAAMPLSFQSQAQTVSEATRAAFNEGMTFKLEGSFG